MIEFNSFDDFLEYARCSYKVSACFYNELYAFFASIPYLKNAEAYYALALTLGIEVDREIARLMQTDISKALKLDSYANSAIEVLANESVAKLKEVPKGYKYFSKRYSPGFRNFPLEYQKELLKLAKIGGYVTHNSENMLIPQKTITAIIGLSDTQFNNDLYKL